MTLRSLLSSTIALTLLSAGTAGCGDDTGTGGGGGGGTGGAGGSTTSTGGSGGGTGGTGGGTTTTPSLTIVELGLPVDLTPDGSTALIQDLASLSGDVYTLDTSGGDPLLLTSVGDPTRDLATAMAATQAITALHADPVEAGVFGTAWRDLPSPFAMGCDQDHGAAWDLSADGTVVVGMMWNGCAPQAFRWTDDGGDGTMLLLDLLGTSPTTPTNRATVISDDGARAAGFASLMTVDRTPALWEADGSGFLLDPANVDEPGEVLSISEDGAVVGGTWGNEAFTWTEQDGRKNLPRPDTLLPSDPCYANAISAGGDLVFGGCGNPFFTTPVAVVWTSAGVRPLVDVLTDNGVEAPTDLALTTVLAASNDGSVLLGAALDMVTFDQKTFVVHLPPSAF